MKTLKKIINIALIATVIFSCTRDNNDPPEIPLLRDPKLIVLNEGLDGANNASITLKNLKTGEISQNVFSTQNGRHLGDLGNDILVYGGKIYIAMGGSATIEITDLEFKSIRQILLTEGAHASPYREPQSLAAYNGNVYIVCFSGYVLRLDTLTLEINGIIEVGDNPEGIAISNGFAFVANSGGMNFLVGAVQDSTVSVINLATFTEERQIVVGLNPMHIGVDASGNIIVHTAGNWADIPAGLHRINGTTRTFDRTFEDVSPSNFVMNGDIAFYYKIDWSTFTVQFIEFNTITGVKRSFINDPSAIGNPHAININRENGNIYVSDADFVSDGSVFAFDSNGDKLFEFPAGLWPKRIVVLR